MFFSKWNLVLWALNLQGKVSGMRVSLPTLCSWASGKARHYQQASFFFNAHITLCPRERIQIQKPTTAHYRPLPPIATHGGCYCVAYERGMLFLSQETARGGESPKAQPRAPGRSRGPFGSLGWKVFGGGWEWAVGPMWLVPLLFSCAWPLLAEVGRGGGGTDCGCGSVRACLSPTPPSLGTPPSTSQLLSFGRSDLQKPEVQSWRPRDYEQPVRQRRALP